MATINFRGKEISKLEAKVIISKLKFGLISPDLNEQEQKSYTIWKKAVECLNQLTEKPNSKELKEKEYLIGELNFRIQLAELEEKIKYCKEHGHIPASERVDSGQGGTNIYGECKRCEMGYNRPLSSKEWENFNRMMNTPMTI